MGTHPNVILMAVLTPDDLSRKTMREILADNGVNPDDYGANVDTDIKIGEVGYHNLIMEDTYDDSYQIAAKVGDLVFFDFVTYGYGDVIVWEKLESQKIDLENWAKETSEKHHCTYEIFVTANYW